MSCLVFPFQQGLHPIDLDYYSVTACANDHFNGAVVETYTVAHKASGEMIPLGDNKAEPAQISGAVGTDGKNHDHEVQLFEVENQLNKVISSHRLHRVARYLPQGPWNSFRVEKVVPEDLITQVLLKRGSSLIVVFDPRGGSHEPFLDTDWSHKGIQAVTFVTADVAPSVLNELDSMLRLAGMVSSGRLWGPAGTTRLYVRPKGLGQRVRASQRELRVHAGALIVRNRDRLKSRFTNVGPLGAHEKSFVATVAPFVIEGLANMADEWRPGQEFNCRVDESAIEARAEKAYDLFGVFPISFSHPGMLPLTQSVDLPLSYITPGFPYSFNDQHEYLAQYGKCALALTHKKAGWDCFRHVEILAAGAVPLMPDVRAIPPFSMIHYPKSAMQTVLDKFANEGLVPDERTRESFRRHFLRHLTTRAMADYILRMSSVSSDSKLVFFDQHTPTNPDYLSTLTLIGMKEIFGESCEVAFPADFLYRNSHRDTRIFYGRGFGYTKVLDPALRTLNERLPEAHDLELSTKMADVLIVGSVSRNRELADDLVHRFASKKIIFIHGEDTPPCDEDYERLTRPGVIGFVRSIDRNA